MHRLHTDILETTALLFTTGAPFECFRDLPTFVSAITRQETQLSLTNRATHLCKYNGVANITRPSPYVLPCRIWSSALKGIRINTGEPQNGDRWNSDLLGWEAWLAPRYTHLPTCLNRSNLVVLQ